MTATGGPVNWRRSHGAPPMPRRSLHWTSELSNFKADRAARAEIRFEPVRGTAGLKTDGVANALGAWRGLSGRRYVVKCIPLCIANAHDLTGAVAVGASIDSLGKVSLVGVTADCANPARWLAEMAAAGCQEVHLHNLCTFADDRSAIVSDLSAIDALSVREAA